MKAIFSIILCTAIFSVTAQQFVPSDVQQLKAYCKGIFVTDSSNANGRYKTLSIKPFWEQRKDGVWLLVKQSWENESDSSGVFFVWHFYLESSKVLPLQLLYFKDSLKAVALFSGRLKEETLLLQDITAMNDCEIYLTKEKSEVFKGFTKGKDCFRNTIAAEYLIYTAEFSKTNIAWGEAGFDKNEKQVWGEATPSRYKKRISSKLPGSIKK
jgi:hypothetical protein